MIKNLVKVCASNTPLSPKVTRAVTTPRNYCSEANEYVHNISAGNIAGVDPSVIDECPVCSTILRELHGDRAPVEIGSQVHIVGKVWLAPLSVEGAESD